MGVLLESIKGDLGSVLSLIILGGVFGVTVSTLSSLMSVADDWLFWLS